MIDYDVEIYQKTEQFAIFSKAKEKFGSFGNMSGGYGFYVNNVWINSTETLYQAMRFTDHPDIQKTILAQRSGMSAKMCSKHYRATHTREDWDDVRVQLMDWVLRLKLANHFDDGFGQDLIACVHKKIVEYSRNDPFWGAIPDGDSLIGQNVLGKLLDLRVKEFKSWISAQNDHDITKVNKLSIPNFKLLGEEIEDQKYR